MQIQKDYHGIFLVNVAFSSLLSADDVIFDSIRINVWFMLSIIIIINRNEAEPRMKAKIALSSLTESSNFFQMEIRL